MIAAKLNLREKLSQWLGGVGRALRLKGDEATDEAGAEARPTPRDEAEEALWQAMGWNDPEGEDAMAVARRKAGEVL